MLVCYPYKQTLPCYLIPFSLKGKHYGDICGTNTIKCVEIKRHGLERTKKVLK